MSRPIVSFHSLPHFHPPPQLSAMSTVPTQHMVSATFGAMLAGILIQQLLLGSIINQAYNYYYRFHDRDSMFYQLRIYILSLYSALKIHRYLVAALLTFNALQLAMDM
jgi:hypothetical protein